MDNRIFTVLSNYAGATGEYLSCGMSGAWSPAGDVVGSVDGVGEALLVVELDPAELTRYQGDARG
jgi:predicted amidohydrolase